LRANTSDAPDGFENKVSDSLQPGQELAPRTARGEKKSAQACSLRDELIDKGAIITGE
jgi:hypothetical protein